MFNKQIHHACTHFPVNNTERYILYPALAIYSPIENLIRTAVGGIFTVLSLGSFGLYPPINNIANWTRSARGVVTVPLQIIGNIFEVHSKILTRYNIDTPNFIAYATVVVDVIKNPENYEDINRQQKEKEIDEHINDLCDFKLRKAEIACTKSFQSQTDSKIEWIGKHILFRFSLVLNGVCQLSYYIVLVPFTAIFTIPQAVYYRGKSEFNANAFLITKIPVLIHMVSLTLRMIVNPNQFVIKSALNQEKHPDALTNASISAHEFWEDPLEMGM